MVDGYPVKFTTDKGWKEALDAMYDMKAQSPTTLSVIQKTYLDIAREKLKQLRDEVPLIEASIRVNEILDYLYYVE